jgi:hypothetical protein
MLMCGMTWCLCLQTSCSLLAGIHSPCLFCSFGQSAPRPTKQVELCPSALPLKCHRPGMAVPWHCHRTPMVMCHQIATQYHGAATAAQWPCYGTAMVVPFQRHGYTATAMALPHQALQRQPRLLQPRSRTYCIKLQFLTLSLAISIALRRHLKISGLKPMFHPPKPGIKILNYTNGLDGAIVILSEATETIPQSQQSHPDSVVSYCQPCRGKQGTYRWKRTNPCPNSRALAPSMWVGDIWIDWRLL